MVGAASFLLFFLFLIESFPNDDQTESLFLRWGISSRRFRINNIIELDLITFFRYLKWIKKSKSHRSWLRVETRDPKKLNRRWGFWESPLQFDIKHFVKCFAQPLCVAHKDNLISTSSRLENFLRFKSINLFSLSTWKCFLNFQEWEKNPISIQFFILHETQEKENQFLIKLTARWARRRFFRFGIKWKMFPMTSIRKIMSFESNGPWDDWSLTSKAYVALSLDLP